MTHQRSAANAWFAMLLLAVAACTRAPDQAQSGSKQTVVVASTAPVSAARTAARTAVQTVAPVGAVDPLPLLPLPAHSRRGSGEFLLQSDTAVHAVANDAAALAAAREFVAMTAEATGATLPMAASPSDRTIRFATDPAAPVGAEGYVLEIAEQGVTVRARDAAGLFYGGVSLWQLLTAGDAQLPVKLAAVRIQDSPRFAWRGFMLDSARHLQSVAQIKRLLDQMARHKLNTFHWHLTDDQGWRLEIKRYPKLTEVGAWRIPAGKSGQGADGKPLRYGGYYTQAQAREIVAYARRLHITIVPEIELPGHAQAAIAAYPQLGVTGTTPPVSSDWGVHTWLFNVEDETFAFLEHVLTEVMAIFPGRYIHIGGDEADKFQWRNSAQVQAKRRALGLQDDMALQSWFVTRIERFLVSKQRRLIGWDEILEGGLPPEATVMSWRGMKGAVEAATQGHDVVVSPSDMTYINRMQSEYSDEPPGHDFPISLQRIYAFEPVPPELSAAQHKHIIGTQANLWTEYVRTDPRVEHMTFPRLSALAEVAWSPKSGRDFAGFLQRLVVQMRRFERAGIRAADSAFAVRFEMTDTDVQAPAPDSNTAAPASPAVDQSGDNIATVTLSNQTDFGAIHYTLDGSNPSARSARYTQPLQIELPSIVTATTFVHGRALASPRRVRVDAEALRTREVEQLASCRKGSQPLRLEDDEPLQGERVALPVDISGACWVWKQAPQNGSATLRADIVDLPFNFQFGGESAGKPTPPLPTTPPTLQVFAGHCRGRPLASAPVRQTEAAVERIDVRLPPHHGARDLCLKFDGDQRRVLWAIDRIALLPQ